MEPFFIFCAALVLYCGYLTLIDLMQGRETAVSSPVLCRNALKKIHEDYRLGVRDRAQAEVQLAAGRRMPSFFIRA